MAFFFISFFFIFKYFPRVRVLCIKFNEIKHCCKIYLKRIILQTLVKQSTIVILTIVTYKMQITFSIILAANKRIPLCDSTRRVVQVVFLSVDDQFHRRLRFQLHLIRIPYHVSAMSTAI